MLWQKPCESFQRSDAALLPCRTRFLIVLHSCHDLVCRCSSGIQPEGPSIANLLFRLCILARVSIVTRHRFFALWLIGGFMLTGAANAVAMPAPPQDGFFLTPETIFA